MDGHGEVTVTKNSYQGTMHMTGTSHGQDIDMTTHYSGKKLGKSCDASKPTGQMTETAKPAAAESKSSSAAPDSKSRDSGDALKEGAEKLKGLFGF